MTYEIIPIEEKYIESFWHAFGSVAREGLYLASLDAPPLEKTKTYMLERLKTNLPYFVALVDDKVVGWCDISSLNRPVFAHSGSLGMGIIAEYRGQGIGKKLMQIALEKAKEIGLTRVELGLREENTRAIEMYKKFGFVIEGIKRNACKVGDIYSNDLVMGLLFDEK